MTRDEVARERKAAWDRYRMLRGGPGARKAMDEVMKWDEMYHEFKRKEAHDASTQVEEG